MVQGCRRIVKELKDWECFSLYCQNHVDSYSPSWGAETGSGVEITYM